MDGLFPEAWRNCNAMQRDILVALAIEGAATGNAINERLGRDYESRGPVHRNLASLRERGLVVTEQDADDARAKRNQLTADGIDAVYAGVVRAGRCIVDEAPA